MSQGGATGRLIIDGSALTANYALLCRHASADVGAVVKANAYGLGAEAVALSLWRVGARAFFVATAEEGLRLRRGLFQAGGADVHPTIFVLAGVTAPVEMLVRESLTPVINTLADFQLWPHEQAAAVHLDTGMQRLGLDGEAAREVLGALRPALLLTHLARADEVDHPSVARQVDTFHALRNQLAPEVPVSICNSAGILGGVAADDLARAGVALYGGNPFSGAHAVATQLRAVVTLEAKILQIRDVVAGTPVGYGGAHVTDAASRIAVLGAGYADGLPRLLSGQGSAMVKGQKVPIIGRVSMDMVHVDVSALPPTAIACGDWVELLGDGVSLDAVAAQAQTIPYEILTGLDAARRLERVYR